MNKAKRMTGIALATSAAAMFLATPLTVHAGAGEMVKCAGLNTCKGKTFCKSATNACKGQNSCKGQGFVPMPEKSCDVVGGKNIGAVPKKKG